MKKMLGLSLIIVVLTLVAKTEFSSIINVMLIIGCVLAMILVTIIGRKLLDSNQAEVDGITTTVQAMRLTLMGIAITKAIQTAGLWTMGLALSVPQDLGLAILIITGAALAFTMINLAARGLGAPALALSAQLATGWMYKYIRNPMVLALFAWLVAWGLYLQSGAFVSWVLFLVVPVEVFFEKHYEEKELEVRFGESYIHYKEVTPFMFPKIGFIESFGKTMVLAGKRISLFALVLGLSLAVTVGVAFAETKWTEIPFSNGGAFISDVKENQNIMVFWFLSKKISNPSEQQAKLTDKADSWTYEGRPFEVCLRKIEVNFSKSPRMVRSAYAVYFDKNGKQVGNTEVTQSDWAAESGPRLWADLMRKTLAKKGNDDGKIPTILVSK